MFARTCLALIALAPLAPAQTTAPRPKPLPLTAEPLPSPPRHAGIYHVASGTWTRTGGPVANFGPDVLYSNTADTGYFTSAGGAHGFGAGSENFDEGGLPGTTNGHPFPGGSGPVRDTYQIDGFEIGYCDDGAPASGGWEFTFYSSYSPCTNDTTPGVPKVVVTGLPASGGCWIVTIDLEGSLDEFCLEADGGPRNPGWQNGAGTDSFGWSYRYAGSDGTEDAGFMLAGDPKYTDPNWTIGTLPIDGTNTYYGPPSSCGGDGTGYLTQDFWWLQDPAGSVTNCYFFGGYRNRNGCGMTQSTQFASFWMELYGDVSQNCTNTCIACAPFCTSNPNSTGANTLMDVRGSAVAADDVATLRARNVPPGSFGFFLTSRQRALMPFMPPNSQGLVCLGNPVGRFIAPGQVKSAGPSGEITLSTTAGEWSLTAIPNAVGTYAAMTGVTSNFQLWHRDLAGGAATSNFSDAVGLTWQ